MSKWYQPKVKYTALIDGKSKVISELYLIEGVNYGEVEKNCYDSLRTRMKGLDVDTIAKSTLGEPVFYAGSRDDSYEADPFWRIGIETGEKYVYLVPAKDADEAISRALKFHGYGERKQVFDIKRTDILGVWHPKNALWQGDWWNRMELLLEQKKCSWDINQTNLFESNNPDVDPETGEVLGATPDFVAPGETEEQRIARELTEHKLNVPALQQTGIVTGGDVVSVDAEDLDNGQEPEHYHEARLIETPQLGPGQTDAGEATPTAQEKVTPTTKEEKARPTTKTPKKPEKTKAKTARSSAKGDKVATRPANRRRDWVSPSA